MKKLYCCLLIPLLCCCVVTTTKKSEAEKNKRVEKDIKKELHYSLNSNQSLTCDLTFLLRILERKITPLSNEHLDDIRLNNIKDDLISTYHLYKNKQIPFVISQADLELKINCYLDYILNPNYEYVSFWKFWKDSYYLKYPCKK